MAYNSVMANGTHETSLLPVMRASMYVILHTIRECEHVADRRDVEVAVEVNPFPAVLGPCRPAERFSNPASDDRLFKCSEVFASHGAELHAEQCYSAVFFSSSLFNHSLF